MSCPSQREGAPRSAPPDHVKSRPVTSGLLLRGDHHHHLAAFQAWARLDDDVLAQVALDPVGHLATELLMAHLAATEADVDLDLVALFQEAAHVAQLDLVVALVGDGAELHFLDLDLLGLLLGLVGLLLLLELELAEIHDLADRRIRVRLDLDQVEAFFLGHPQGVVARQDADHFAVAADHAHARHADLVVLAVLLPIGGADVAISGRERAGQPVAGPVSNCCLLQIKHALRVNARRNRRRTSSPGPPLNAYAPPRRHFPSRGPRPPAGTARAAACARGS